MERGRNGYQQPNIPDHRRQSQDHSYIRTDRLPDLFAITNSKQTTSAVIGQVLDMTGSMVRWG